MVEWVVTGLPVSQPLTPKWIVTFRMAKCPFCGGLGGERAGNAVSP